MIVTAVTTKTNKDYLAVALAKAEHYDVIADLVKRLFNAQSTKEFLEVQGALKQELKFLI